MTVELDSAPTLMVPCEEKGETIVREVRLGRLTTDRLRFLWDKLKGFDTLFNDYVRGDFAAFVDHFLLNVNGQPQPAGLMWDVDDVGILFLNELKSDHSATAHFCFWDGRFRGREKLCREMVKLAFDIYGFRRIEVQVPHYAKKTLHAVQSIGFVSEGIRRQAIFYKDQWFDVRLFSVIKEDLEKWDRVYSEKKKLAKQPLSQKTS